MTKTDSKTDDAVIERAQHLCDRGDLLPHSEQIEVARLRRRISNEDALESRHMVPALIEIIERRGLK